MTTTSIKLTTAAAAITSLFFVMSAPAYAEDYCITGGAQAGHGCGYPSMETCRAAAAGISGSCSLAAGSSKTNPSNANAMVQKRQPGRVPNSGGQQ